MNYVLPSRLCFLDQVLLPLYFVMKSQKTQGPKSLALYLPFFRQKSAQSRLRCLAPLVNT